VKKGATSPEPAPNKAAGSTKQVDASGPAAQAAQAGMPEPLVHLEQVSCVWKEV